ncbi:DUF4079 domain-containing protein [cf. Phormidesmis sp. LEGE 11477]|uniref:DUF4079 domain-containing protein n=1 Tax=cf. Phormidesmis sp. LEGE 11477 TaxID=1828680 RepID=UPI001881089B|nr:DUF4079 domain-containing protein [cf. Phormidesmis sp. LEGE 11477]MBE9064744.1 DUF4079 domain-containing protein [cf. Phormidesmis sp. LEGE 11477]
MNSETIDAIKPWLNFIHPVLMWGIFALTLYAGYLGYQHRQTRLATGEEKKQLIKGKFLARHHQAGSVILASMVIVSIGGMGVTYLNNGKLFFGPHLLAGLGMMGLIASSASLVPFMKNGNDTARYTHIALNTVLVGLFGWQAVTGVQIVQRILSSMFS